MPKTKALTDNEITRLSALALGLRVVAMTQYGKRIPLLSRKASNYTLIDAPMTTWYPLEKSAQFYQLVEGLKLLVEPPPGAGFPWRVFAPGPRPIGAVSVQLRRAAATCAALWALANIKGARRG